MEGFFITKARHKMAQGDAAGAVRLMRHIVQFPILAGLGGVAMARYALGQMLTVQDDYAGAADQWEWIITHTLPLHAKRVQGFEADVRRRLADNLEALGRNAEADAQRQRAKDSLAGVRETSLSHSSRGKMLQDAGKHSEAYAEFEQALDSSSNRTEHVEIMAQLMLSAHKSGRPEQCAEWAEAAIIAGAQSVVLGLCHRMAGVGYSDIGELEAAEHHYKQATACAENAEDANQSRALLAGLLYKRGQMVEAIAECDEIISSSNGLPKGATTEYTIKAEALRDLGRFDEAMEVKRLTRTPASRLLSPSDRRQQALRALGMAWIAAGASHFDEALEYVREAEKTFSKDQKIGLWVASTEARIQAQRGNRQDSISLRDGVLRRLAPFAADRATMLAVYGQLGRAAYHLEDWTQCRETWETYLAQKPNPVSLPLAHYFLGECDRAEGDLSSAAEHYRQAQTVNPDLHFAKLAAQRLREMAV